MKRWLGRWRKDEGKRLWTGLRQALTGRSLDAEALTQLRRCLLQADTGREATQALIDALQKRLGDLPSEDWREALEVVVCEALLPYQGSFRVTDEPTVVLVVGVNGAGKTTTVAKLAMHVQALGHKVLLAAGDTFRAAAIEQLETWGKRQSIPVVSQALGADSAAVLFDGYQSAKAKGCAVMLADTAGRLHTQQGLLDELKKVKRTLQKCHANAPHLTLLVLDGSVGQNGLSQARQFHQAVGVDGLVMTKMDGTAKGGALLAITRELSLPIYFMGTGERAEDLEPFDAKEFARVFVGRDDGAA